MGDPLQPPWLEGVSCVWRLRSGGQAREPQNTHVLRHQRCEEQDPYALKLSSHLASWWNWQTRPSQKREPRGTEGSTPSDVIQGECRAVGRPSLAVNQEPSGHRGFDSLLSLSFSEVYPSGEGAALESR